MDFFMITENQNELVTKALNSSFIKLSVTDFIKTTEFSINEHMLSHFWQVVVTKNLPPHVNGQILEWLGYEGEPNKRKEKFIAYLKRNNIGYEDLKNDDERVQLYPTIQTEILSIGHNNVKKVKWLIMNSRDFKKAIMKLSTKRGDAIRDYYLCVEELMQLYIEYEKRFETRKLLLENTDLKTKIDDLARRIDDLKEENSRRLNDLVERNDDLKDQNDEILGHLEIVQDKLDIATDDRAPKTICIHKRERFILFNKKSDDELFEYYVIRGQQAYCTGRMSTLCKKYPRMSILIDIEYQPNAINLFNRFKEQFSRRGQIPRFRVSGNNISLGRNNETVLINAFNALNNDRKFVELDD